jgi:hypothetical protein
LLDAVSCGIKLSLKGTSNPAWYCEQLVFSGDDLGDLNDPAHANLAIVEVNNWVNYNADYEYYDVRIEPAFTFFKRPSASMTGPGRRLQPPDPRIICSDS